MQAQRSLRKGWVLKRTLQHTLTRGCNSTPAWFLAPKTHRHSLTPTPSGPGQCHHTTQPGMRASVHEPNRGCCDTPPAFGQQAVHAASARCRERIACMPHGNRQPLYTCPASWRLLSTMSHSAAATSKQPPATAAGSAFVAEPPHLARPKPCMHHCGERRAVCQAAATAGAHYATAWCCSCCIRR